MTPRQPQLNWIKEVLADLAADAEHAPESFGAVRRQAASANAVLMDDPPAASIDDDRVFCPSWPLIRLAVTRNP
jgi:hypothetical protein